MAEQCHFRTKTAIGQALRLRGGRDFDDESAYLEFVRAVVDRERNARAAARLAEERAYLRPLPPSRIPEYTTFRCRVRKWSTIRVGGRICSVPSRLIGHTVEARQHPSTVEVVHGGRVLCTMPRLRGGAEHRIDYRHVIGSLVRKPGAFARYRFRGSGAPRGSRSPSGPGAVRRVDLRRRSARMTAPSTQVTTLLTKFGLATAAEDLVPRLTQAGHHGALPVLLEVFEAEADARRQRRITRLRRASRLPPGKTFATLDSGRLPGPVVQQLETLAAGAFLDTATNVLAFGLPGVGKSHALCAVGHAPHHPRLTASRGRHRQTSRGRRTESRPATRSGDRVRDRHE